MSRFMYCCADCRYAECHYAECRYGECHYAKCHYAECHYDESRYAYSQGAFKSAVPLDIQQGKKIKKILIRYIPVNGIAS